MMEQVNRKKFTEKKNKVEEFQLGNLASLGSLASDGCLLRILNIPILRLYTVALNPVPHMAFRVLQQKNNHLQFDWPSFDNSKQFFDCSSVV